jgi:outer membrane immunogenic protein
MMTKMIRTGMALAALLVAPIAAQAADLSRPSYKAPAYSEPAYMNWSGFYVGINGGYGFGRSTWDFPVGTTPQPKGAVYGVTLGYNFQTGTWVWGAEGDIDMSSIKGTTTCGVAGTCETKNDWLGTARLRLGYAGWNNLLPYITGGAAFGDIKATSSTFGSASKTKFGYVFGGGLEYAFYSNWSVKAEYLYASLGDFDCGTSCGGTPTDSVDFKTSIVRAGLNYRF